MPGKIITLLILIFAVANWSCFFRNADEMTADADEEISRSQALQDLEKMCLSLPFFNGIKPGEKMVIRGRMVSYEYRLGRDFNDLKAEYKNKFLSEGWILKEEKRLVADEYITFTKDKLEININKSLTEEERYSVSCKNNSILN